MLLSPLKCIREKCLDCCGSAHEVKLCTLEMCPLHPYRFGKNPNRAGKGGGIANLRKKPPTQSSVSAANSAPEYKDIPKGVSSEIATV